MLKCTKRCTHKRTPFRVSFLRIHIFVNVKKLCERGAFAVWLHISNNGFAPTHIPQHRLKRPLCRYCSQLSHLTLGIYWDCDFFFKKDLIVSPVCRFFLSIPTQTSPQACTELFQAFPWALLLLGPRHVTERQPLWQKEFSPLSTLAEASACWCGRRRGLLESGCVMKMGCVCLTVRHGREEACGWGAHTASSEDLLQTGMQKECSHSSVQEEEDL